jgi:hypothetical protein
MSLTVETGLLLLAIFAGLYAGFYARRAYQTGQKILDKLGK